VAYRTTGNDGVYEQGDKTAALNCNTDPSQQIVTIPIDMRNAGRDPEKYDQQNRQGVGVGQDGDPSPTVDAAHVDAVAFQTRFARNDRGQPEEVCPTLQGADAGATSDMRPCVQSGMAVRRLTPRECERLQGFPDDYTLIPYGNNRARDFAEWLEYLRLTHTGLTEAEARRLAADGPRYRALGNSMAVPVMRWIGQRILEAVNGADQ
jgi:DNA (cytosine-5)-methyltransferase 1